jgi:alpha-beta hydrolase superfamily lysophospholipase
LSDPQGDSELRAEPGDALLVVHGYIVPRLITTLLTRRLAALGYRALNLAYPSLLPPIEQVSSALDRGIRELAADPAVRRVHLVTHSMGGLLTRCALRSEDLRPHIGRIVMLTPPNAGSKVATLLTPACAWFSKPMRQMSHRPGSFVNRLPPALEGFEVGVIAASRDRLVHAESTHLRGQADHITLRGSHTSIVFSRTTVRQVAHFLKHGRFAR